MPPLAYIRQLQKAIRATHGCESNHLATTPVVEEFAGRLAWQGDVEEFELVGHPKAQRCFAWGYDEKGTFRATAVLKIPPATSPKMAVRVVSPQKLMLKNKRASN